MSTNTERIAKAHDALIPYLEFNDDMESITDLLTDLRHYADARKIDFYKALDMSYQHYLAEKGE